MWGQQSQGWVWCGETNNPSSKRQRPHKYTPSALTHTHHVFGVKSGPAPAYSAQAYLPSSERLEWSDCPLSERRNA